MDILYWGFILATFIISFIALIYPIIPGLVFLILGFVLYGLFYSFSHFTPLFWAIQMLFIILLFGADYFGNYIGVKKYGGSKAAVWGSMIGLLVGPFVIPIFGIVIGPFIGAIVAELIIRRTSLTQAVKIGFGSVIGFFASTMMKTIVQLVMILYFFIVVL